MDVREKRNKYAQGLFLMSNPINITSTIYLYCSESFGSIFRSLKFISAPLSLSFPSCNWWFISLLLFPCFCSFKFHYSFFLPQLLPMTTLLCGLERFNLTNSPSMSKLLPGKYDLTDSNIAYFSGPAGNPPNL